MTIEELDNWASWYGLMEDDMVNLRRLQLLADGIIRRNENENDSYFYARSSHPASHRPS